MAEHLNIGGQSPHPRPAAGRSHTPHPPERGGSKRKASLMRKDPLASVSRIVTGQIEPIPGVPQVRNAAGGYVFAKDQWTSLEDFLILGTTGGTFYTGAEALTAQNVDLVLAAIAEDGPRVVGLVTDIATAEPARAPKPRPYLFAFAAAAASGRSEEHTSELQSQSNLVCRLLLEKKKK